MPGKRIWRWAVVLVVLAPAGCRSWCDHHYPCAQCPAPAPAAYQPCVPCCPQPAAAPQCCPVGYAPQQQPVQWVQPHRTGGICDCQ